MEPVFPFLLGFMAGGIFTAMIIYFVITTES